MATPNGPHDLPGALAQAVQLVRDDREHGATWLARQVGRAVLDAVGDASAANAHNVLAALREALRAFVGARPSMAAVANAAAFIWRATALPGDDAGKLAALATEARRLVESEETWRQAMAGALRPVLRWPLYTLSRSATVERLVLTAAPRDHTTPVQVLVNVSQPGGEGVAAARAFADAGLGVTLLADAAVGLFASQAAMALVGADSVRADGSVVNKVGTYPLALAAREAGVPFYSVCETLKIAAPDFPLRLEEMNSREILPQPVDHVVVHNVYFDVTPTHFITGVITERGILRLAEVTAEAHRAGEALSYLLGTA